MTITLVIIASSFAEQSLAQPLNAAGMPDVEFGPRKMFLMLFLMLGPIKILVPFVSITAGWEGHPLLGRCPGYRRLAWAHNVGEL
ncbi:hypothetical protein LAC81_36565 (plasmid) [Ensifer adhaerens]|uniref:hypothetical protein n=1 Tax=Ensifer adhaerens TaxID=106592 RepID=UPI001CBC0E4B|nr:hypothetical protein [Ensifer adhaerens]MBZ7927453.1 hypothetical protein [Ensifer adhaerens]UAX97878.1 hypothetical protein LAC78_37870 [Ensifer adhaerens]UAY05257.1 hypothetical protein LAC80_36580 [Ensifer adhaerens]UAY12635.1 hypothetical protein LAC81_36565 [Ensifer adhaerens]